MVSADGFVCAGAVTGLLLRLEMGWSVDVVLVGGSYLVHFDGDSVACVDGTFS